MSKETTSSDLIVKAANLLRQSKLVAFPTETVYGLGADASSAEALARLYKAKGRPTNHPVIVHVSCVEELERWAKDIPSSAYKLAAQFSPGPLTLILKRASHVLDQVTGGQDSVGLRIPSHPLALALLKEFGGGVAAPSANRFGKLSPTSAADVEREFGDEVAMVLDGGPCTVGIESTIVDLSRGQARILRPGMILPAVLGEVIGCPVELAYSTDAEGDSDVRVPGGLPSHYAPNTPLQFVNENDLESIIAEPAKIADITSVSRVAVLSFQNMPRGYDAGLWINSPRDPIVYARHLYKNLRELDSRNADLILIETLPSGQEWSGIKDRLTRASQR